MEDIWICGTYMNIGYAYVCCTYEYGTHMNMLHIWMYHYPSICYTYEYMLHIWIYVTHMNICYTYEYMLHMNIWYTH